MRTIENYRADTLNRYQLTAVAIIDTAFVFLFKPRLLIDIEIYWAATT